MTPQATDNHWLLEMLGHGVGFLQNMASVMAAWAIVMFWRDPDTMIWGVWLLAFISIAAVLNLGVVLIHELGHAVAAWSVRHQVLVINVRSISFAPQLRRIFREAASENREYAGYVLHDAPWPDLGSSKTIWISLGGPLATGALGILVYVMAPKFGHYQFPSYFVAALLILDFALNLIPLRWGSGTQSDGLHIWQDLSGVRWTPEVWAGHRMAVRPYRTNLVATHEWEALRSYVKQPFFGGPAFRRLLAHAAKEHGDQDSLSRLPAELLDPPLKTTLSPERGQP